VQPALTEYEYELVGTIMRGYAPFVAACEQRGLNPDMVCMDPWCAGYFR
jgi:Cu2+-containing amine oxidase